MIRSLTLPALVLLALAGCGDRGPDPAKAKANPKLMEELASRRDHIALVISGRLMGEIYPCG